MIGPLVALSVALAGCGPEEQKSAAQVRPVRVVAVENQEGGEIAQLAGIVESQVQVDLAFRIGGRMIERNAKVGDALEAGQTVARLDSTDEENGLRSAEANLTAAEGRLSEAKIDYERQRHLYQRQVAARAAFERAEQVFTTAKAAVEAAKAQVGIAQQRLDDTELNADAPGVVTVAGAEPGEIVQPGRMIVQLARDDGKDAVFNVPATLIGRGDPDPEVTVSLSQNPSVTAKGRVREVSPRADRVTGTFQVRVGLIDPPEEMRLGSTIVGRVRFGGEPGIELPATALTQAQGEPAVWVVDPTSNKVELRQIGVGRHTPATILVSEGLKLGELVVTAGAHTLIPGQQVRLSAAQ